MAAADVSLVCRNTENQIQLFKTLARFCDFDPEPSRIPTGEANRLLRSQKDCRYVYINLSLLIEA